VRCNRVGVTVYSDAMRRQVVRGIGAVAAVLVSLVLSHDLVFLTRYGSAYGEALAHAGHGPAWTDAVLGSIGLGAALLVAGLGGLIRLRAHARRLGARPTHAEPGWRAFIRSWATSALRLVVATSLLLTIQENLERVGAGISGPNIRLLVSADYPYALPIVSVIAIAVAFVAALVGWRRAILVSRIRGVRRRPTRVPAAPRPYGRLERRPNAAVAGITAMRAPPLLGIAAPA
jgi:hypothetical protein